MSIKSWCAIAGLAAVLLTACTSGHGSGGLFGCADPAPLNGTPTAGLSPEFIVVYDAGVDATAETQALAAQLGFVAHSIDATLPGFTADLDPTQLRGVRCASSVQAVYCNAVSWPL